MQQQANVQNHALQEQHTTYKSILKKMQLDKLLDMT